MSPHLSIVVPTFNRAERIGDLIASLESAATEASLEVDVEVIVVSDGSTDATMSVLASLQAQSSLVIRPFELAHNQGAASARNLGIAKATGSVVWMVDDDMIVSSQALARHFAFDHGQNTVLVGPCVLEATSPVGQLVAEYYDERFARLAQTLLVEAATDFSPANTSALRSLFTEHRFDESFRGYGFEDFELGQRLLASDVEIRFDPDAQISHRQQHNIDDIVRLKELEGKNRVAFVRRHPGQLEQTFPNGSRATSIARRLTAVQGGDAVLRALTQAAVHVFRWKRSPESARRKTWGWVNELAMHSGAAKAGYEEMVDDVVRSRTAGTASEHR